MISLLSLSTLQWGCIKLSLSGSTISLLHQIMIWAQKTDPEKNSLLPVHKFGRFFFRILAGSKKHFKHDFAETSTTTPWQLQITNKNVLPLPSNLIFCTSNEKWSMSAFLKFDTRSTLGRKASHENISWEH